MFNDIHIGPLTLHMYGLMIAVGFLAALFLSIHRGKKRGLSEDAFYGIFVCALLGGIVGSKLLYWIVSIPEIIQNPSILLDFRNGFVVYGGIIGGIVASWIYLRVKKRNFLDYFDVVMPSVALAQGFGRLGCFFAGCCYGRETDGPFCIVFTHSDFAPNNVPLIPTQLMSSAGDFLIALFLVWFASRNPKKGRVGALYLILYGCGRFVIEFFRGDPRGAVGALSTSQLISLVIVAAGLVLFFLFPKRAQAAEAKAALDEPQNDQDGEKE